VDDLIHGGIYTLRSRNLRIGVWNAERKSFVGIRTKFGSRFLDCETHWDAGGTATPMDLIGHTDLAPVDGWWDDDAPQGERWTYNGELFPVLDNLQVEVEGT
jgi:hypothetical protein